MNKGHRMLVATLAVFALATAVGAFFSARCDATLLYDYFKELSGGEISIRTKGAVMSALSVWSVLFFSAFFKFGIATSVCAVVYRGFVDGYSVASILRILGFRGLPLCFFDILCVPVIVLMTTNVLLSLNFEEARGKGYIVRSILLLAVLVAVSVLSAFLADKVMNWVMSGIEF